MRERKIAYYIPLVTTRKTIEFSAFRLKPLSKELSCAELVPPEIFNQDGSLIEVNGFNSGDSFSREVDIRILDAIERIKFGYFFLNPSHNTSHHGYVSNETFECFRLFEKNPGPSFEQKVPLSNGMFDFSESLKTYHQSRTSLKQKAIHVTSADFSYVNYLSDDIEDAQQLTAMRLFNRCWSTHSIHSYFEKAL